MRMQVRFAQKVLHFSRQAATLAALAIRKAGSILT